MVTHQHPKSRSLGEFHRTILQMLKMGIKNHFSGDIKDKNKISGDRRLHKGELEAHDTASIYQNPSRRFTLQVSELPSHDFLAKFTVPGMSFLLCRGT